MLMVYISVVLQVDFDEFVAMMQKLSFDRSYTAESGLGDGIE